MVLPIVSCLKVDLTLMSPHPWCKSVLRASLWCSSPSCNASLWLQISMSNNNKSWSTSKTPQIKNEFALAEKQICLLSTLICQKIQLNIIQEIKFQNVNIFDVHGQLFTIKLLFKRTPRLGTETAEQKEENRWLEISEYCPGFIFILKSVLVPGLVKCLSVILQRTSFLMQLHPIWPFSWQTDVWNPVHTRPVLPPPTETLFLSFLGFNFGLRSIHFKNPILKSQYYCSLLLGMSKKHNDLSLTL